MTSTDVAVTGLGVVSPAGLGTAATWEGLCAGKATAARDPLLAGIPVDMTCALPGFDAEAALGRRTSWRLDPFIHMALVAADEAVADAGLDRTSWDPERVGIVLGVGSNSLDVYIPNLAAVVEGRFTAVSPLNLPRSIPNMAAGEIAAHLGAQGPNFTVSSACASGATAIGVARDLVRSGTCDVVITGGSESGRSKLTAVSFWRMGALSSRCNEPALASRPFDVDRDGFVLGEGAGVLVLERMEHARARQARIRAVVAGYGASADAYHFTSPHPDGRGAQQAMRTALADAGLSPSDIDHVNAHGTSTRINDAVEYRALRAVFGQIPPITAIKSVIGHALGAAGALEAVCAILTLQHQLIPPTANLERLDEDVELDVVIKTPRPARMGAVLSNSFGFGGQNAALVLRRA